MPPSALGCYLVIFMQHTCLHTQPCKLSEWVLDCRQLRRWMECALELHLVLVSGFTLKVHFALKVHYSLKVPFAVGCTLLNEYFAIKLSLYL